MLPPPAALLAAFDAELRRDPPPEAGFRYERSGGVVRAIGPYCWIPWWEFGAADCDDEVAAQAAAFAALGRSVEWKVYGHDAPANLAATLTRHGFVPDESETVMVLDLRDAAFAPDAPPAGIEVRRVCDERGLADLVDVTSAAFEADAAWMLDALPPQLFGPDPRAAAYVAYVDGRPAGGGRLEFPGGRSFASMWGGGTIAALRRRGIFRALVAARAAYARDAGYPYLFVEARAASRPALERFGFVALTTVRGWNLHPGPTDAAR